MTDQHPDEAKLTRIRDLTRQIDAADERITASAQEWERDQLWDERQQRWWERAALLVDLQEQGRWHPICLAAELRIGIGLLSDWEDTDDAEVVTFHQS